MNAYQQADPVKLRDHVPVDLKQQSIWLLWKSGSISSQQGKPPKVPYYADGKRRGDRHPNGSKSAGNVQ